MPTYVYACKQCEGRKEVVQRMSDAPLRVCESCGGELRKVLFPPAVVYKGSGFYVTDYKNGGSKSESSSASSSDSSKSTESAKSTDSAASTESKSTETKSEAKSSS